MRSLQWYKRGAAYEEWSQIVSDSVMDIPVFRSICHAIKVSVYEYVKVDFDGKS